VGKYIYIYIYVCVCVCVCVCNVYSVQILLSSSLLSKNLKIKIYRTMILPVLCGCETWWLTLREEHKLRVSQSKMLRETFVPEKGRGNRGVVEIT
jgi:hypothetical protein